MKYLLSGSNGFIGRRLGAVLLDLGYQVRSIPRDLLYEEWNLTSYLESEQPDVMVHLAAYGNHSDQKSLVEAVDANIMNTVRLLEASKNIPYTAFINISTSSVHLPVQTYYSATKKATEHICEVFAREYDKPVVTVRPYSVFGEGERENRLIPTIIKSAKHGLPLTLVEEPKHDWIYIDDFVAGVLKVIERAQDLSAQAVDIGNGKEYSNKQVLTELERIHGSKILYDRVASMRVYDADSWVCDTQVIEYLGYKQHYSFSEALKRTYDSY